MSDDLSRYRVALRAELPFLARSYGVAGLALFGSRLRGTARPDSDLDILATFDPAPSLFQLIRLEQYLSDLLGVSVDLVPRSALKPHIGARIEAEAVAV